MSLGRTALQSRVLNNAHDLRSEVPQVTCMFSNPGSTEEQGVGHAAQPFGDRCGHRDHLVCHGTDFSTSLLRNREHIAHVIPPVARRLLKKYSGPRWGCHGPRP